MKLTDEKIEEANNQLIGYTYGVGVDGTFYHTLDGRPTSARITETKGSKFYVRGVNGNLLWSGPNVTKFVEDYWYAEKPRAKNPLDYVITVMSQRTGAIGYWDGEHFDDDMRKAYHAADKTELETILAKIKKTLPKGWVIGLQPVPVRKPRLINPRTRKGKNPVPASKYLKIKQAIERFKDFTGMDPEHLDEYAVQHPDVALVIGTLDAVSYTTVREGQTELYEHKFKKSCRPLLCTSFDGKQLVILGGEYTFTERGIVDEG